MGTGVFMLTKFIWAAMAALCVATPAIADDCKPQFRVDTLDMVPIGNAGQMLVPVTINGVSQKMLFNTGAGLTTLSAKAAGALGLRQIESNVRMLSDSGNAKYMQVHIEKFQLGEAPPASIDLMVSVDDGDAPYDGMYTNDLMYDYDAEIDFANHKLNYFSTDHCEGRVIYWPASAVAVIPITLNTGARGNPQRLGLIGNFDTHIRVPVTLDGKPVTAVINTASPVSNMSTDMAKYVFGVTADSPGSTVVGNNTGDPEARVFTHVFASLSFDGLAVTNLRMLVHPNLMGTRDPENTLQTGSRVTRVDDDFKIGDLTIGLDVLKHLHLYVATGERRLYITPASAPSPAPAAGKQ
jgi:gag-polyprotein putative aspartyl protease